MVHPITFHVCFPNAFCGLNPKDFHNFPSFAPPHSTLLTPLSSLHSFLFISSLRWLSRCQAWPWVVEAPRQPLSTNQEPLPQRVGPRLHRRRPARPSALSCGSEKTRGSGRGIDRMASRWSSSPARLTHPSLRRSEWKQKKRTTTGGGGGLFDCPPHPTHLHHGSFKRRWRHTGWTGVPFGLFILIGLL